MALVERTSSTLEHTGYLGTAVTNHLATLHEYSARRKARWKESGAAVLMPRTCGIHSEISVKLYLKDGLLQGDSSTNRQFRYLEGLPHANTRSDEDLVGVLPAELQCWRNGCGRGLQRDK